METIRSLVDGLYYPADPGELRELLARLLETDSAGGGSDSSEDPEDIPAGVLVPHGGYDYTGATAAAAYRRIRHLEPERILILAPLHRDSREGICLPPGDAFQIPLGTVPVDRDLRDSLADRRDFFREEFPFLEEPSVEAQLPFLHTLFPGVPVLPLFLSGSRAPLRKALAAALSEISGPGTLSVVTSNITGWLPWRTARDQAEDFRRQIEDPETSFHPGRLLNSLKPGLPRPCGLACLAAWWQAAEALGAPRMSLCAWGPDEPLPSPEEAGGAGSGAGKSGPGTGVFCSIKKKEDEDGFYTDIRGKNPASLHSQGGDRRQP